MANMKKLAEYAKGVCPLYYDLDYREREEFEQAFQEEGVSIYTDFVKAEVKDDGVHYFHSCTHCNEIHERVLPIETDYVYIGQAPSDDDRYSNYTSWLICTALIVQLRNTFGKEPEGARLYLKTEADGYKEVCCEFNTQFPLSYAYAMMLEGNLPEKWSNGALEYLAQATKK